MVGPMMLLLLHVSQIASSFELNGGSLGFSNLSDPVISESENNLDETPRVPKFLFSDLDMHASSKGHRMKDLDKIDVENYKMA